MGILTTGNIIVLATGRVFINLNEETLGIGVLKTFLMLNAEEIDFQRKFDIPVKSLYSVNLKVHTKSDFAFPAANK